VGPVRRLRPTRPPRPARGDLTGMAEAAPDAIKAKALDGTLTYWNAAAERLYGYTAAEVVGRSVALLFPSDRMDELADILARVARGEPVGPYETERVRKDGRRIPVSVGVAPLRDRAGAVVGAATITRGLAAAEERFRQLVESAPDGVVLVDGAGRILLVNAQVERLFGYRREELVGQPVELLVPEPMHAAHRAHRAAYAAASHARPMGLGLALRGRRKDGSAFPVEISLSPLDAPDGTATIAAVRDATERRAAEEQARQLASERAARAAAQEQAEVHVRLNAELRALADAERAARERTVQLQVLTAALAAARTPAEIGTAVVDEQGLAAVGASAGAVLALSPDGTALELLAAAGYPTERVDWMRRLDLAEPAALTAAARTGAPVWLATPEAIRAGFPEPAPLALGNGSQAHAVLPLAAGERPLGVLALSFPEPRHFGDAERAFLATAAHLCAQALDRARLYEAERAARVEAQRQAERTARLQAVTAALGGAATAAEVAEVVLGQALPALDANAGQVLLLSADGAELELLGVRGYPPELLRPGQRVPATASVPIADAVRSGEPVLLASPEERGARYPALEERAARFPALGPHRAWAAYPLGVDGRTVGVLALTWLAPRGFDDEDRAFMRALAQQCTQALERARLLEAERAARTTAEAAHRRAAFLAEASATLGTSLDYERRLAEVARLAVPALADWCAVDLLEPDGSLQRVAAVHADPAGAEVAHQLAERFPSIPATATHTALRVVRSGEPWFDPAVAEDRFVAEARSPEHLALLRRLGFRGEIVVPLVASGTPLGTLTLVAGDGRPRYTPDDLALAAEFAGRCALAIDNARLHRRAQEAVRARDEFIAVAAHDLRAPLTTMRGYAQLALRQLAGGPGPDPERLRRALGEVDAQTRRLERLIGRLLDVARLEGAAVALERAQADVAALVEAVVEGFRVSHPERVIAVRAPEPLPAAVDPVRLEEVVANLLDNALKYAPVGAPVEVEVGAPEPETVRIAVRDHGPGIPPERRARLFERFYQAHEGTGAGGVGLGLYISRHFVGLHGGTIAVEAPEGGGTRFVVLLPRDGAVLESGTSMSTEAVHGG
jgi:PAS domain S-box-containing protein